MTQVLAYAPQLPPSSLLALHSASQAEVSQTAQRTNVLSFSRIRPQLMSASPRASTPRHSHPSSPSGVIISERNGETGTALTWFSPHFHVFCSKCVFVFVRVYMYRPGNIKAVDVCFPACEHTSSQSPFLGERCHSVGESWWTGYVTLFIFIYFAASMFS